MMTTDHTNYDYDYTKKNNKWKNYSNNIPNNAGFSTNRSKHGPYNITERDYGDRKVLYYVPSSYENDYDISQLDEQPVYPEQQRYHSPVPVRRRYHQSYDDDDDDYIEEFPARLPRRHKYVSTRRPRVVKKMYYHPLPSPPPSQTIEYIYSDDYRPENEETIEFIVPDRTPRQRYTEEFQPIHRPAYVENLPPISRSPRASPTPRSIKPLQLNEFSSPRSIKSLQLNEFSSPRHLKPKEPTPRIRPFHQTPRKFLSQTKNNQKHISLKDILAENRARRGSRIPKPRREVDEEEFHDRTTYNKHFIKNDYIVYK